MKKYELLTIVKPNLDNDEADKVAAKLEDTIKDLKGSVIDTDKTGRKKLAFDVKGFRDGYISIFKFNLPEEKVTELKRQLKLNDNIIRTMFTDISKVKA